MAGGVAHHANKKAQSQAEADEQADDEQREQEALDAQAAQQQAVAPSGGLSGSQIDDLTKLAALKDQGILTEDEFAAQKAKILG